MNVKLDVSTNTHDSKGSRAVKTKIEKCPFCGRKTAFYLIQEGSCWNSGMGCKCGVEVYFFKNGVNVSHGVGNTIAEQKEILARWNHREKKRVIS